jgi:hypothetical protein
MRKYFQSWKMLFIQHEGLLGEKGKGSAWCARPSLVDNKS